MTAIKATRLCAEAMGITHSWTETNVYLGTGAWNLETSVSYQPLHDDAQAMALVKRFRLDISALEGSSGEDRGWIVFHPECFNADDDELNRAIVYCVAAMQNASTSKVEHTGE